MDKFPVLRPFSHTRKGENCPKWIDWAKIAPFERQVIRNHSQSLEKLAQRGGLSPTEIYAAMNGLTLTAMNNGEYTDADCVEWIKENCF